MIRSRHLASGCAPYKWVHHGHTEVWRLPTARAGTGSIKRWGMKRGLMTHGSKSKRQHGSIGSSATPSRVLPGLKMAGHMGNSRVKVRKVKVSPSASTPTPAHRSFRHACVTRKAYLMQGRIA